MKTCKDCSKQYSNRHSDYCSSECFWASVHKSQNIAIITVIIQDNYDKITKVYHITADDYTTHRILEETYLLINYNLIFL